MTPLPCPFCGKSPKVVPSRPDLDGNTWGMVLCRNKRCPAQPVVEDGIKVNNDRGSDAYKQAAIRRWNRRAGIMEGKS